MMRSMLYSIGLKGCLVIMFVVQMQADADWRYASSHTKEYLLGNEALSWPCLDTREGYKRVRKKAKETVDQGVSAVVAMDILKKEAESFFPIHGDKISHKWCRKIEDIDALVDKWLPGGQDDERAFLFIMLYVSLYDTQWVNKLYAFDAPFYQSVMPDFEGRYRRLFEQYLRIGKHLRFVFRDNADCSVMEHCVALEKGVLLCALPSKWNVESPRSGGHVQGFLHVLAEDMNRLENAHFNKILWRVEGYYPQVAAGALELVQEHWQTNGLQRLALWFCRVYKMPATLDVLTEEGDVHHMLWRDIQYLIFETRPYFCYRTTCTGFDKDAQFGDMITELCQLKTADDHWEGLHKKMKKYMLELCTKIHFQSMRLRQMFVLQELEESWKIKINNDMKGYRNLLYKVLNHIFSLEKQEWQEKNSEVFDVQQQECYEAQMAINNFFRAPDKQKTLESKVYFVTYDPMPLPTAGVGFIYKLMGVPLKKDVDKMTSFQRRYCLGLLLNGFRRHVLYKTMGGQDSLWSMPDRDHFWKTIEYYYKLLLAYQEGKKSFADLDGEYYYKNGALIKYEEGQMIRFIP